MIWSFTSGWPPKPGARPRTWGTRPWSLRPFRWSPSPMSCGGAMRNFPRTPTSCSMRASPAICPPRMSRPWPGPRSIASWPPPGKCGKGGEKEGSKFKVQGSRLGVRGQKSAPGGQGLGPNHRWGGPPCWWGGPPCPPFLTSRQVLTSNLGIYRRPGTWLWFPEILAASSSSADGGHKSPPYRLFGELRV